VLAITLPIVRRPPVLAAVLVGLASLAYSNAPSAAFTFDDVPEILQNPVIERLDDPAALLRHAPTRPLVHLSYALDYAIWGGRSAFGFHLTNVLLHLLAVVLFFLTARRLLTDSARTDRQARVVDTAAFLAAGLLAVHPILTQAVTYVAARAELVVTVAFLASLLAFWRSFSGRPVWVAGGWVMFILALLAKETAVVLPLVLLASDVVLSPRADWRRRLLRLYVPLVALVGALGLARAWVYVAVENTGAGGFEWGNAGVALLAAARYLGLVFVPYPQTVVHAIVAPSSWIDVRLIVAAAIFVTLTSLAIVARRRAPLVTLGLSWFVLALVPSSALILLADVGLIMAEHRLYLPGCGLFLAVGAVAVRLVPDDRGRRARALAAASGLLLVGLSAATHHRNRIWSDPIRLWEEAVRLAPASADAATNLAAAYMYAGDTARADLAFERALAVGPGRVAAYAGYADSLLGRGDIDRGAAVLRLGIENVPRSAALRLMLARLEERAYGNVPEALRLCREALALDPGLTEAADCVRRLDAPPAPPLRGAPGPR
jgi:protein O-mannosyl-transferase